MPTTPRVDDTKASIARVYDAFVGGKDNFEVDREVYKQVVRVAPEAPRLALDGRQFLGRAITYLVAECGIDQFLDLGCGFPTADNTHQVANRANPDAVTVYVDNDATVAAHARAILERDPNTFFTAADLRDPTGVLQDHIVAGTLDMRRPLGLIQAGTLHHLDDGERPGEIMRAYTAALAPGSVVVFTHFCTPADGSPSDHLAGEIEHCFRSSSMGTSRFRTREDLRSFLHGLELLPASAAPDAPTIVPVRDWWPCGPPTRPREPMDELFVAAIGRKPDSLMPQTNYRNEDR